MDKQRIQVLLIENEPVFREQITELLTRQYAGVDISEKTHLPLAHEFKGDSPDIILMDPYQDDGDEGFEENLSELKTLYPDVPIVFITKNRDPETIIECFRLGITDYLLKPFQEEEFKRMFQRVLYALQSSQLPALEGIFQVCQQLNLCRSVQRFFYILALYIAKVLTSRQFVVLFKGPKAEKFEVVLASGISKKDEAKLNRLVAREDTNFLEIREILTVVMSAHLPRSFQKIMGEDENFLFVAFGDNDMGNAVLGFEIGHRPREFVIPFFPKIERLLNEAEVIFSNLIAFLKTREIALKDDVTGLYNMRSFEPLVKAELREADKQGYAVSALFLDIDDFKKVNDSHGHLVGSRVLKEFADVLRQNFRKGELIFRYGGDEFVVILPATPLELAKEVGERVLSSISHHLFHAKEGGGIHLTASIGIATYPNQAGSVTKLLKIADEAMYHGKRETKNVVYVAGKSMRANPSR